jgi:tetratricopeptide (TPR) repeat protein
MGIDQIETQTNNNKRAKSKTITEVFKDTYPSNLTFRKQLQNKWVYDFPRNYYDLIDKIEAIENNEKLTPKKYQDKLLDILEVMPYHAFAAVSLADFYQYNGEVAIAKNCYEITLKEYLDIIPPKFKGFIPWGYLNNREFLRLLHGYGLLLLGSGDTIGSEVIFEQLIKFNPNDNQGIREILMNIYVSKLQIEKALNLAKSYPDDSMAGLILGEVLTLYIINKRDKAKRILKKNSQRLSNVFIEIFKNKHVQPKNIDPGFVTYMGKDEAYYYWCDQGYLWDEIEGAKPWLKETLDGFLL